MFYVEFEIQFLKQRFFDLGIAILGDHPSRELRIEIQTLAITDFSVNILRYKLFKDILIILIYFAYLETY